jgi:intraflagellar transport protein 172
MSIYKTLSVEVLAECQDQEVSDARIMIKNLIENIYDKKTKVYKEFERYYVIFQLLFLKNICKGKKISALYAKICVALLRYTNEVRVDKAFYEAGAACQNEKWLNMAFVFLNRYLDLADAIQDPEGGVAALGDSTDFEGTDIPTYDIPLPDSNFTSEEQRERIKDWVLEISMNQKVEQSLSCVNCDNCGSQMYEASLKCFSCNASYEPCLITGYPVMRRTQTYCSNCNRLANKDDWSEYLAVNSTCPWCSSIQN